jgi:hypothetical protein
MPDSSDADLETACSKASKWSKRVFYRLRAGRWRKTRSGWMFDNEIDWVIAHRAEALRNHLP